MRSLGTSACLGNPTARAVVGRPAVHLEFLAEPGRCLLGIDENLSGANLQKGHSTLLPIPDGTGRNPTGSGEVTFRYEDRFRFCRIHCAATVRERKRSRGTVSSVVLSVPNREPAECDGSPEPTLLALGIEPQVFFQQRPQAERRPFG